MRDMARREHGDLGYKGRQRFIPEIFVGKITIEFYKFTISKGIFTDYEGSIKKLGDTVLMRNYGSTFPRAGRLLCADQAIPVRYFFDDILEVQSDIGMMDYHCREIAVALCKEIETEIHPPIAFAGQLIQAESCRHSDSLSDEFRALFIYGTMFLDPFRWAAATAIKGRRKGLTDEEILDRMALGVPI
jgi:hypothetical protein